MKRIHTIYLFAIIFYSCFFFCNKSFAQIFNYPHTKKQPVTDTIFGKVIVDNYRWLEDANNSEVQTWLKSQADLTNQWLEKIPGRNTLMEEYERLDQINTVGIPYVLREKGRYFYIKILRGENVGKLYYRQGETGKEILLFNPQEYAKGQSTEITYGFLPSKDGKKVALALTENGKIDICTVKFIDVNTKEFYPDSLYPVMSLQAWTPNNEGFIYGALQTTDQLSSNFFLDIPVKVHQLGTSIKEDKTVISRISNPGLDIKPSDLLFVNYSLDNKYLIVNLWGGAQDQNRSFFASVSDLNKGQPKWNPLAKKEDQVRNAIIYKEKVYLLTRKDAPNRKLMIASLNDLDIAHAQTIIAESNKSIDWMGGCRDFLFIQKTDGINTTVEQYNFSNGEINTIQLPLDGFTWPQTFDAETNDCVMHISSWKQPTTRYNYNPLTGQSTINAIFPKIKYPGADELVVEEVEIKSHDGVMVPLSLIYNKNLKKDGNNIVYMTGYGSYGSLMEPYFDLLYLPLLNNSIIIAQTHPRGGGEKGFAWHMGGFKTTKPNTWKDFIACGEYLINKGYTSARHLIGEGASAGGIMIGRAMTERPDLFVVAINNVPLSNPLRGENRPNGALDAKEFGTVKDSVEAMALIEMDAYLHVTLGVVYPAVIAVSGINDTRVPVWQPAKLIAALQSANPSGRPIFLMINYDSGHWSDEKFVMYRNYANVFSLALWQAGHKDFQLMKENSK